MKDMETAELDAPAEVAVGGGAAASLMRSTLAPAFARATVLVVDDYDLSRLAMKELLRDEGYRVLEARTVAAARDFARHERIDLLITDFVLPDGRGEALFGELRRGVPNLPVLYVSALADDAARVLRLCACPMCHYLQKPLDLEQLVDEVATLVED